MPEITGIDKLFSVFPRKRFSLFRLFGTSQFAHSNYGEDDLYFNRTGYGKARFGKDLFADIILLSGIYRTDNVTGKTKFYREPFYITKNPRTPDQQAHRHKYGEAVGEWRALTPAEKSVYNERAIGKRCSGWNLFYKEYLESY